MVKHMIKIVILYGIFLELTVSLNETIEIDELS